MKSLGATQLAILRTCSGGAGFICSTTAQRVAALKLNARGLLDRDLRRGMSSRYIGNAKGDAVVRELGSSLAEASDGF